MKRVLLFVIGLPAILGIFEVLPHLIPQTWSGEATVLTMMAAVVGLGALAAAIGESNYFAAPAKESARRKS